jgi:hypothetical protein
MLLWRRVALQDAPAPKLDRCPRRLGEIWTEEI